MSKKVPMVAKKVDPTTPATSSSSSAEGEAPATSSSSSSAEGEAPATSSSSSAEDLEGKRALELGAQLRERERILAAQQQERERLFAERQRTPLRSLVHRGRRGVLVLRFPAAWLATGASAGSVDFKRSFAHERDVSALRLGEHAYLIRDDAEHDPAVKVCPASELRAHWGPPSGPWDPWAVEPSPDFVIDLRDAEPWTPGPPTVGD